MYGHAYIVSVKHEDGSQSTTVPVTRETAHDLVEQARAGGHRISVTNLIAPAVARLPEGTRVYYTPAPEVVGVVAPGDPGAIGGRAGQPSTAYWAATIAPCVRVHVVYDQPRPSGRRSGWWPESLLAEVRHAV